MSPGPERDPAPSLSLSLSLPTPSLSLCPSPARHPSWRSLSRDADLISRLSCRPGLESSVGATGAPLKSSNQTNEAKAPVAHNCHPHAGVVRCGPPTTLPRSSFPSIRPGETGGLRCRYHAVASHTTLRQSRLPIWHRRGRVGCSWGAGPGGLFGIETCRRPPPVSSALPAWPGVEGKP